ncbi:brain and acute leukemia cytoplasmic protein isoform 3-T3 [Megaptera novaeangliae]
MGCGGSRADAIEPRYYESWTRETESTWLTYTDSDASPSNATPDSGPEAGGLHAAPNPGKTAALGAPGSHSNLKRSVGWAGRWRALQQCAPIDSPKWNIQPREEDELWDPVPKSPGPQLRPPDPETEWLPDHRALFKDLLCCRRSQHLDSEAKRDAKRTSGKEVTINVADSIRQVDRSRRITKNCVN